MHRALTDHISRGGDDPFTWAKGDGSMLDVYFQESTRYGTATVEASYDGFVDVNIKYVDEMEDLLAGLE